MEMILSVLLVVLSLGVTGANAQIVSPKGITAGVGDGRYVNVTGDTMTGALAITANSFSVGTSTFVVSAGKVGVGGTPAYNLSVKAPTLNGNQSHGISIYNSGTGAGTGAMIGLGYADVQTSQARIAGFFDGVGPAMYFETAASERMRITAGGNVGIGNKNPDTKLHVSSGTIKLDGTGSPAAGKALCFTAAKLLGVCTDTPAADGSCTCN